MELPERVRMTSPSDVSPVVSEVLRGNRDAFRRLVDAFSLPLRSYLAGQIYRLDDVDDVAQEVFIAAYRNLDKFRLGDDFALWLRGIARNEVLMYFRTSARRQSALERFRGEVVQIVGDEFDAATAEDRSDRTERLLLCISQLPERLRRVVRAGLDGAKPAAMAAELGTTPTAVYNLHYRANQLLRVCLQKGNA